MMVSLRMAFWVRVYESLAPLLYGPTKLQIADMFLKSEGMSMQG